MTSLKDKDTDKFFTITWYVDDGYVNPGPKTTQIYYSDLEGYETDEEIEEMIRETIQEDFMQQISWFTEKDVLEQMEDQMEGE